MSRRYLVTRAIIRAIVWTAITVAALHIFQAVIWLAWVAIGR